MKPRVSSLTEGHIGGPPPLRYRRLVAKLGTNVLTAGGDRLDLEVMAALVGQVARLQRMGARVIIVSSGAIAAGRHRLGLGRERRDIPQRQVLAAVGQTDLMNAYQQLFAWHDITVAQTLLTRRDLADRQGYLNARNTLLALLELGVVPIVNENDVVAVEEIEGATIGDNDNLSALVANLVEADLLVLLTDTDGLYTADPYLYPDARPLRRVERIDEQVERLAQDSHGQGRGGMITKLQAARLATASGTDVVIAHGRERDVLVRLATGEELGTLFPASVDRLEGRKRWLLAGLSLRGSIVVDEGAARALRSGRASLLPAGVKAVQGQFQRGDVVAVLDERGRRIACGIANYGAREVEAIRGIRSDHIEEVLGYAYGQEIVHRDNLVLLKEE
ncbi:MAG: glutamate 5-kinase [Dehalococcoidia bacterium]|nr:glutamate 5-kinase [Dehalococcoidia bacterium]MDW8009193.1 glutamate 5-kinase [Chloroflexota bacterium]